MIELDILVVGGGPAGLLFASLLGVKHRVGLIEKGTLGKTTKYWVTTERRLERYGLQDCILHKAQRMQIGTFLGGKAFAPGDFAVVDDNLLLRELLDRCRRYAPVVVEGCALLSVSWTEDGQVEAQTTGETYRARLVLDATGTHSPIAQTFRLHRIAGFYSVYGARVRNIKLHTSDIVLAHIGHLGDPPPILEVIPCGPDSAYCAVFIYSRNLEPPEKLTSNFHAYCQNNPFFTMTGDSEIVTPKLGSIAIGSSRGRSLPGVLPVGEAAIVQPPMLGTAFNEILEHSERTCRNIDALLGKKGAFALRAAHRHPPLKRAQDLLQLTVTRILLRQNVEVFDKLVRFMDTLPPAMVFKFCSNELTWVELFQLGSRLPLYFLSGTRSAKAN